MTPPWRLAPLQPQHIPHVVALEAGVQSHPWDATHFADCLRSGYWASGIWLGDELAAYAVAMPGVEEAHLLNLAVGQAHQGQGLARWLLLALGGWALALPAHAVWLEVRCSNQRALQVYRACGFVPVATRKAYYPGVRGGREDALVMQWPLQPLTEPAGDAGAAAGTARGR